VTREIAEIKGGAKKTETSFTFNFTSHTKVIFFLGAILASGCSKRHSVEKKRKFFFLSWLWAASVDDVFDAFFSSSCCGIVESFQLLPFLLLSKRNFFFSSLVTLCLQANPSFLPRISSGFSRRFSSQFPPIIIVFLLEKKKKFFHVNKQKFFIVNLSCSDATRMFYLGQFQGAVEKNRKENIWKIYDISGNIFDKCYAIHVKCCSPIPHATAGQKFIFLFFYLFFKCKFVSIRSRGREIYIMHEKTDKFSGPTNRFESIFLKGNSSTRKLMLEFMAHFLTLLQSLFRRATNAECFQRG
jgi:hypothetical protein